MEFDHNGAAVRIAEGKLGGQPAIRLRTRDALTLEHAMSIYADLLTERGWGDTEVYAAGWNRGAWEAWYKRPAGWTQAQLVDKRDLKGGTLLENPTGKG